MSHLQNRMRGQTYGLLKSIKTPSEDTSVSKTTEVNDVNKINENED